MMVISFSPQGALDELHPGGVHPRVSRARGHSTISLAFSFLRNDVILESSFNFFSDSDLDLR